MLYPAFSATDESGWLEVESGELRTHGCLHAEVDVDARPAWML